MHLPFVFLASLLLAASLFIPYPEPRFRSCTFLWISGYPCPFCGCSRSFAAMTGGDWAWAWRNSPMAVGLYLLTLILFVWNLTAVILGLKIKPGPALVSLARPPWKPVAALAVIALLNWIYRLTLGFDVGALPGWF